MGMRVSLDGELLFTWSGGPDEVKSLQAEFRRRCATLGYAAPDDTAASFLFMLHPSGLVAAEGPLRELQMMAVTWYILSQPTGFDDRPGTYADYVPAWDFDFDLSVDLDRHEIAIKVVGTSGHWA